MGKRFIFFTVIVVFLIAEVLASSIGISPAHYKNFFTPNFEETYEFYVSCSDAKGNMTIYARGDLEEYVKLSKKHITGEGYFDVEIDLPKNLSVPGNHPIYVGAIEAKDFGNVSIGGLAAVEARIDIFVPYPGIYLESSFNIDNVNVGENIVYEIILKNLGTEDISVEPTINLFEENESIKVFSKALGKINLSSKHDIEIKNEINAMSFKPGKYFATLTLDYEGKSDKIRKDFRIGEFIVEIVDYSYLFEKGKINPFRIEIESKWNTPIDTVYADVKITDEGNVVEQLRTSFTGLGPWEIKNLTGYLDATKLESKRYIASIDLFYGDVIKNKLVAVYVQDRPEKETTIFIIIGIVLLIALVAILFLIIKIKKLKSEK
ncbi:MAG: hypothetical protein WC548_00500 [Candidatus Pacearchaeota archaeon]